HQRCSLSRLLNSLLSDLQLAVTVFAGVIPERDALAINRKRFGEVLPYPGQPHSSGCELQQLLFELVLNGKQRRDKEREWLGFFWKGRARRRAGLIQSPDGFDEFFRQ